MPLRPWSHHDPLSGPPAGRCRRANTSHYAAPGPAPVCFPPRRGGPPFMPERSSASHGADDSSSPKASLVQGPSGRSHTKNAIVVAAAPVPCARDTAFTRIQSPGPDSRWRVLQWWSDRGPQAARTSALGAAASRAARRLLTQVRPCSSLRAASGGLAREARVERRAGKPSRPSRKTCSERSYVVGRRRPNGWALAHPWRAWLLNRGGRAIHPVVAHSVSLARIRSAITRLPFSS
jgi:hypothetical protein